MTEMVEALTHQQLNKIGYAQVDPQLHQIHELTEIIHKDGTKMILIIQLNVSHNEVMVMRLVQRNEMITTLTVMMGEIVTEHQLRIVGYAVVDLRLQLILEKDETMDIIKTTTQILSSEFRYVEMDTKSIQRNEMMVTLTVEMGDHLNE